VPRTLRIPEPVLDVCRRIDRAGHRAWVVGGCVRDLLMGKPVSDWDLATSALPGEVQAIFKRTIPTGIQHGTVTVLHRGKHYEVTTLRGEGAYTDGRRPDTVEFVRDIEDDLARRDFTVNAIAYDPLREELVDPWGGLEDLDRRIIRAVGDPRERFGEDGLRVLRAARFAATLGFSLDPATEAAIAPSLETFKKVSAERVHEEWRKALAAVRPSPAFEVMRRTWILAITCEPLASEDDATFARTMARVDRARAQHELRLAALLLDVEPPSPEWADAWLRGMRAANHERRRVLHLLAHARVPASHELDDAGLRRWLSDVGRDAVFDVIEIARADGRDVAQLEARARAELERGVPLTIRELAITGDDVMRVLGSKPGRYVGDILAWLLDRVLEDPSLAARDRLIALVPEAREAVAEPKT
jgi:tRNA nucleotidyltransferase (CCA-adding enzyme)